ncbi:MAG: hypothetical protein MJK14_27760 [Rivularia sp. ALOHA_DT_140]|nr:hypothetical protein [Rivularia sp. ALOHA_DT_140]
MTQSPVTETSVKAVNLQLERDVFLRTLVRELSGTLENVVGLKEASGFISVVGQTMGRQIDEKYKSALKVNNLSR